MKNVTMIVVLVLGFCGMSYAQDTPNNRLHGDVEFETEVHSGEVTPQVKTFLTYGGKGKLGAYCWIQNSKAYNQAYCGPTYAPKSWLQVGVAVGVQTGPKRFQAAAFVWVGKPVKGKMVQNLFIFEKGGHWYRNVTSVEINKRFTASLVTQRYSGTGPRLDIKLAKGFSAGIEINFDKSTTSKVGLKYSF